MPARLLAAQDKVLNGGCSQGILNDLFDADVFCFSFAGDAKAGRGQPVQLLRKPRAAQGRYRYGMLLIQGQNKVFSQSGKRIGLIGNNWMFNGVDGVKVCEYVVEGIADVC